MQATHTKSSSIISYVPIEYYDRTGVIMGLVLGIIAFIAIYYYLSPATVFGLSGTAKNITLGSTILVYSVLSLALLFNSTEKIKIPLKITFTQEIDVEKERKNIQQKAERITTAAREAKKYLEQLRTKQAGAEAQDWKKLVEEMVQLEKDLRSQVESEKLEQKAEIYTLEDVVDDTPEIEGMKHKLEEMHEAIEALRKEVE